MLSTRDLAELERKQRRRRRITTARAFLRALWESRQRVEEQAAGAVLGGMRCPLGLQLERAALVVAREHPRAGEIPIRDDSHLWAAAHQGVSTLDAYALTLEQIWGSLSAIQRRVLTLLDQGTYLWVAEELADDGVTTRAGRPSPRWVKRVVGEAYDAIEHHPLFEVLARADGD